MLFCPNIVGRLVLIQALLSRIGYEANQENVEIWQTFCAVLLFVNDNVNDNDVVSLIFDLFFQDKCDDN